MTCWDPSTRAVSRSTKHKKPWLIRSYARKSMHSGDVA